jgi:hypothetical protein
VLRRRNERERNRDRADGDEEWQPRARIEARGAVQNLPRGQEPNV